MAWISRNYRAQLLSTEARKNQLGIIVVVAAQDVNWERRYTRKGKTRTDAALLVR